MKKMTKTFCSERLTKSSISLIIALAWFNSAAFSAEEFQLRKAERFHARDGLGNVAAKLDADGEVRVAYIGGSITAANGWRPKVTRWLDERYPDSTIHEIHAAIGGTGSDLGVFRYEQDVLSHDPDLVFVEFAVNDGGAPPERIFRAMEGMVRKTWQKDPTIDICFVYTFRTGYEKDLDQGNCPRAASADEVIAEYYGIPTINMAMETAALARADKLVFKSEETNDEKGRIVFSRDGVHPLDAGHEIYLDVISRALIDILPASRPGEHELKAPFREDNWQQATLVPLAPSMLTGSWNKMDSTVGLAKRFGRRMPQMWLGATPGDTIRFRFRGTMVGIYDLLGPNGGQVRYTIDGEEHGPRPRFDWYCTYHRLASLRMAADLEDAIHEVTVTIDSEQPDRAIVTDRVKDEANFDPKKFDGTNVWVGSIMMIGELVEADGESDK